MNESMTDLMIAKGVDIWCRSLKNPKFDNGDDSHVGALGMSIMSMNCDTEHQKINLDDSIEKFRENLSRILMEKKESNGHSFCAWLSCDYGPCKELSNAAEGTGINESMFSIKSSVIIQEDYITSTFGYGSTGVNYYNFGGKWILLKSRLDPQERDFILSAVLDGRIKGFSMEDSHFTPLDPNNEG